MSGVERSSASLYALIVRNVGIQYRTSRVTNSVSDGKFVIFCNLFKKSVVSLMYDGISFTNGAK